MARGKGTSMSTDNFIAEGSGNVFADLRMPDAATEFVKAQRPSRSPIASRCSA